ncbi:MAG: DUF6473 family protein, partial [Paracoccaceae bacterium]
PRRAANQFMNLLPAIYGFPLLTIAHSSLSSSAACSVMQVPGVQNVSNRMYSVHPRRNDRFLRPSLDLARLYPEVDFTDYHFTRHLLLDLHAFGPDRFDQVVTELRSAWTARMRRVVAYLRGRVVLVWLRPPGVSAAQDVHAPVGPDPLFVTQAMVDALRPRVRDITVVHPSAMALSSGTRGMICSEFEKGAAQALPGPVTHVEIARALQPVLTRVLSG